MPTPQHVHLLLNHLPIVGLAFALLPLAWGALRRDRRTAIAGACLAFVATLATPIVARSGEGAEDQLRPTLTSADRATVEEHEERAETAVWALYVTLALSVAALLAAWRRRESWVSPLLVATLLTGAIAFALAAWSGQAGGRIRHVELRVGAPVSR